MSYDYTLTLQTVEDDFSPLQLFIAINELKGRVAINQVPPGHVSRHPNSHATLTLFVANLL